MPNIIFHDLDLHNTKQPNSVAVLVIKFLGKRGNLGQNDTGTTYEPSDF